ncbi:hypothetical protein [Rhizobium sp. PP-CC-3G-465]|uniref:hypothetical protein n=1 Tax=Rhizobium sp. PP-CC-3G-465 TaxID=2135648 RepID=UPI0010458AF1|nr:hypothetical protein C8J33_11232 [Rhizobium sp. PP-CC-3G-465]
MLKSTPWKYAIFAPVLLVLPGWSLFGGSDGPSPDVAQSYLSHKVGNVWDLELSNCSGDDSRQSCIAAYKRSFSTAKFYEELNIDFQKTPSGWNVTGYSVIKTEQL